tara:strand:- start:52 stop:420 length:369 start_codon:yes stop_codon:yes gene_type:complete
MDITEKLHKAIKNLKSTAETNVSGDVKTESDFNKIKWLQADNTWSTTSPHSEITWSTLNAEMTRLQTEYDGVGVVQRKREKEYAPVKEQLDLLYKDMLADKGDKTGEWFKAVKKVKDDNPKS